MWANSLANVLLPLVDQLDRSKDQTVVIWIFPYFESAKNVERYDYTEKDIMIARKNDIKI